MQENQIYHIAGLESLVHLQNLGLAGNRISEYKDIQRLSCMSALQEVSFADVHFGHCPVTKLEGYRNFAVCYLKQVSRLDGIDITTQDRSAAEEAYVEQVLRFNEKIEHIEREHEMELSSIEERRKRNISHADSLKHEMQSSFQELEALVQEGRNSICQEHARQRHVREENMSSLEEILISLERKYADEVDQRISEEQRLMEEEEKSFKIIEKKALAERDQALFIAALQAYVFTVLVCIYMKESVYGH